MTVELTVYDINIKPIGKISQSDIPRVGRLVEIDGKRYEIIDSQWFSEDGKVFGSIVVAQCF